MIDLLVPARSARSPAQRQHRHASSPHARSPTPARALADAATQARDDALGAALARAVAHPRPSRRLLQRDLLISGVPVPSPPKPTTTATGQASTTTVQAPELPTVATRQFKSVDLARAFLRERYAAAHPKAATGAGDRLERLAEVAALDNEVVEVTLPAAMAFIHSDVALRAERQYRDPSRSPQRGGLTDWEYEMTSFAPTSYDAPQSPRRHFDDEKPMPIDVDIATPLGSMFGAIATGRSLVPDYTDWGKNLFRYRVAAHVRMRRLRLVKDPDGGSYYVPEQPRYASRYVDSRLYHSRLELPPTARGESATEFEDEIRTELQYIYDEGMRRGGTFYGGSSLYAYQRARTDNQRAKKVNRDVGDYFTDRTKSSNTAISSLYVHSEVQAAADAHEEAGDSLAEELFGDILRQAELTRASPTAPVELVVVAVTWAGASEPNTVCGGACKGGLVHISEMLEEKFEALRATRKEGLAKQGVFVRGSAELSYSAHVQGRKKFGGYGTGASDPRPRGGGKQPLPKRWVREYPPYG